MTFNMMDLPKTIITCSHKPIAIFLVLYAVTLASVNATPFNPRQYSLVEQCCTIEIRSYPYSWAWAPGEGQLVELYKTPFYHQNIRKEHCYAHPNYLYTQSMCQPGVCQQQYDTQEVIVQKGNNGNLGIEEIRVESGCKGCMHENKFKFVPSKVHPRKKGTEWF